MSEAGYTVVLMVSAGEMVMDGLDTALAPYGKIAEGGRIVGFFRINGIRKISTKKPCIVREYFEYRRNEAGPISFAPWTSKTACTALL